MLAALINLMNLLDYKTSKVILILILGLRDPIINKFKIKGSLDFKFIVSVYTLTMLAILLNYKK